MIQRRTPPVAAALFAMLGVVSCATSSHSGVDATSTAPPPSTLVPHVTRPSTTVDGGDIAPAQPGLPGDGPATVGGVALGSGHVLVADSIRLAWITDHVVHGAARAWLALRAAFPRTGLYPVLLRDDDQNAGWEVNEFFPNQPEALDQSSVTDVLASSAANNFQPPRTFSGLAPATPGTGDPSATDARIAQLADARVALVQAPRGADALSLMGWTGNATYDATEAVAIVVRSWEDRFGAQVVAVGPNSLTLAVTRPPATVDAATALSAELTLIDPDLERGNGPVVAVGLGAGLIGNHLWNLWWS
jgi:hypothetical protein